MQQTHNAGGSNEVGHSISYQRRFFLQNATTVQRTSSRSAIRRHVHTSFPKRRDLAPRLPAGTNTDGRHSEAPLELASLDFQHEDLREVNWREANLTGSDLRHANLSAADLTQIRALGANIAEAQLEEAMAPGAALCGANMHKTVLRNANLQNANLAWSDLSEANLFAADLRGANLAWANLRGANLRHANLRNVRYNCHTQWPDDFDFTQHELVMLPDMR
jgi:uncharacterized protein YjbI with pentapeptide repeats